jgi:hypothetical protein
MDLRVASNLASFSGTGCASPGCPGSPLFPCRLPMRLRVAPNSASSGRAKGESASLPASSLLWLRRRMDLRVSSNFAPSDAPGDEVPGCPGSCIFLRRQRLNLRVAPFLRSSGCADGWFSGLPRIPHPPVVPLLRLRVSPNPASAAGSMMTPQLDSNFASSG